MSPAARWKVARLDEIPALGEASDPGYWRPWTRDTGYGRNWRSIRLHLGITAFGVNACEAGAGEELVVPHTEVELGGQEELYVVVRGRARFVCDGEEVDVAAGGLLYARALPALDRDRGSVGHPAAVDEQVHA